MPDTPPPAPIGWSRDRGQQRPDQFDPWAWTELDDGRLRAPSGRTYRADSVMAKRIRAARARRGPAIAVAAPRRPARDAAALGRRPGREERRRLTAENGGVAPTEVHNASTYTNWGCRCPTCTDGQVAACNAYREANRAVTNAYSREWKRRKRAEEKDQPAPPTLADAAA